MCRDYSLRGRHTRMRCLRLTHVQYRQNMFSQSGYKSLNFSSGVKIPIIKLSCDNIFEGKSLRFFHYIQYNDRFII